MIGAIRSIFGEISFKDKASGEIRKLNAAMSDVKNMALSMNDVLDLAGMAAGFSAIKGYIVQSVAAYADMETQSLRLKHLSGEDYPELKRAAEEAAEASKGLADDSDMVTAANQALKYGASLGFVRDNLSAVQKLGWVVGADTTEMMQQLTMFANTGNARVLKSLPLFNKHLDQLKELSKLTGEEGRKAREQALTNILAQDRNKLDEQYNETLDTTNANLQRIKAQWGEIKELAGGFIIREWGPMIEWIGLIEEHFNKLKITAGDFGGVMDYINPVWSYTAKSIKFLVLAVEDLLVYFRGGESVFGDFVDSLAGDAGYIVGIFKNFKADTLQIFQDVLDFVRGLPGRIIEFFRTLPAQLRAELAQIKQDLKNIFSGDDVSAWEFIKGNLPGFPKPAGKAIGGPVSSNTPYLVGERGPELFVPGSSGSIVPNNQIGGMSLSSIIGSLTINVSGPAEAAQAVESAVMDALDKLSRTVFRAELGMGNV